MPYLAPSGITMKSVSSSYVWGRRSRNQRGRCPSPLPPNDHADCATLGRQRRPRRPEIKEPAAEHTIPHRTW